MSAFEIITKEEFENSVKRRPLRGAERSAPGITSFPESGDPLFATGSRTSGDVGMSVTLPESGADQMFLQECTYCGWCLTPDDCAWSHTCPVCSADPGTYCLTTTGAQRSLHPERWEGERWP